MLGLNLLKQKKWVDAEPILRECLAIREKKQPDDWTTFNAQSLLGGALLRQKKYADAEPLLLKGYEGMRQREKKIPKQGKVRLTKAIDRLIELYTATNKPDDVKRWQAEARSVRTCRSTRSNRCSTAASSQLLFGRHLYRLAVVQFAGIAGDHLLIAAYFDPRRRSSSCDLPSIAVAQRRIDGRLRRPCRRLTRKQ